MNQDINGPRAIVVLCLNRADGASFDAYERTNAVVRYVYDLQTARVLQPMPGRVHIVETKAFDRNDFAYEIRKIAGLPRSRSVVFVSVNGVQYPCTDVRLECAQRGDRFEYSLEVDLLYGMTVRLKSKAVTLAPGRTLSVCTGEVEGVRR